MSRHAQRSTWRGRRGNVPEADYADQRRAGWRRKMARSWLSWAWKGRGVRSADAANSSKPNLNDRAKERPTGSDELYYRYVTDIRHVARTVLGSRTADACEDVCQSVFETIIRSARTGRLNMAGDLRPYIRTMAKNASLNWRRRTGRETLVGDPEWFDGSGVQVDRWEKEERALSLLQAVLASLPEELAALYGSRFVRRQSQERSAQELGMSRQRLRTLERRLKDVVGRAIVDAGFEPETCHESSVAEVTRVVAPHAPHPLRRRRRNDSAARRVGR
jgi:RNA polymerase sigma factor (sigma-70 family)